MTAAPHVLNECAEQAVLVRAVRRRIAAGAGLDYPACVEPQPIGVLAVLFFLAAVLYSSVGHAGASGYLAAMGLVGVPAEVMKPTALVMNICVATIATLRFQRSGHFAWSIFWPFALGSIPLAFIGGALQLPGSLYKQLVGSVLLLSAAHLLRTNPPGAALALRPVPRSAGILWGGVIGMLAGLTGTGGGIFLSPLLLFMGWGETRQTAGVSAAFILANSVAGLAGNLASVQALPAAMPWWAATAGAGGLVGATLGSRYLAATTLRRLLAVVLVVAGVKLLLVR